MKINDASKAVEDVQVEGLAIRNGECRNMAALGLPPDWGDKLEETAGLLERRLARLEQAMGLQPLT